jgi:hypothetical protein
VRYSGVIKGGTTTITINRADISRYEAAVEKVKQMYDRNNSDHSNQQNSAPYGYSDKGDKKWLCNECSQVFFERGVIINSHKREKNIIPPDVVDRWSRGVVRIIPKFSEGSKQRHLFSEVAEMAVMFYSGVGDIVLDPFSGMGSAIMTAVKHKRRFMCFERDENDRKMFFGALRVLREHLEKVGKETECISEDRAE